MQFYLCWICINNCTKTDSGYEGFCSSWGLCLDFRSGERLQLWSCTSPASSGASCCSPALLRAVLLCSEGSGLLLSQQDSEPRPACRNLPGRRVVVSASCASILCFVELFPTLMEAAVMQQPPFLPCSRQQLTDQCRLSPLPPSALLLRGNETHVPSCGCCLLVHTLVRDR